MLCRYLNKIIKTYQKTRKQVNAWTMGCKQNKDICCSAMQIIINASGICQCQLFSILRFTWYEEILCHDRIYRNFMILIKSILFWFFKIFQKDFPKLDGNIIWKINLLLNKYSFPSLGSILGWIKNREVVDWFNDKVRYLDFSLMPANFISIGYNENNGMVMCWLHI